MDIRYEVNPSQSVKAQAVLGLFEQAGISKPNWSIERMNRALSKTSVVACAWHQDQLVGFASAISDFAWIGYLSHLAVKPQFQSKGIGKRLIELVAQELGDEVTLVVHSAESATRFYQTAGFELYSNVYRAKRKR